MTSLNNNPFTPLAQHIFACLSWADDAMVEPQIIAEVRRDSYLREALADVTGALQALLTAGFICVEPTGWASNILWNDYEWHRIRDERTFVAPSARGEDA